MEIKPFYTMRGPNEPILLFGGKIRIRQYSVSYLIESAQIEAMWPPTQHCVIKLPDVEESMTEGKALLDIPTHNINGIPVEIFKAINDKGYIALFKADQFFEISGSKNCDAVLVFIPNFFDIRLYLRSSDWQIEIEPLPDIKDKIRVLALQSGFALTHIGIIKKQENVQFSLDQAGKILRALETYISFMRGSWCGLLLPIGLLEERISWQRWNRPMVMPWRTTPIYWCMNFDFEELNKSFDKFVNVPEYPALINVISFFTGANKLEAPDLDVIMVQVALEILVSLYAPGGPYTEKKDKKIRRLLKVKHISPDIPSELKELYEYCKINITNGSPIDGPNAITYLRNLLMHPQKDKIDKIVGVPEKIMVQATSLGLAYIELILLNVFEYEGHYMDRFTRTVKPLVWSISHDAIQPVGNKLPTQ